MSKPTGKTAICIIPPQDVCGFADGYRQLYMPDKIANIPPHITLLYPFVPYEQLEEEIPKLEEAFAGTGSIALALRGFSTFPEEGILYFHLAHPERVVTLYEKIHALYPTYLNHEGKYGDSLTPHMTIGRFSDPQELERVYASLSHLRLFISWDVEHITLIYQVEDGGWHPCADISLLANEGRANHE